MTLSWKSNMAMLVAVAAATSAMAGGFFLSFYSGSAPVAAGIGGVAVVVSSEGCATPGDTKLVGTAEGLARGKRQSVKLEFTATKKPGVFAVKRQWPAEGAWVLSITGDNHGHSTRWLVEMAPNGKYRPERAESGGALSARIEQVLQAAANAT